MSGSPRLHVLPGNISSTSIITDPTKYKHTTAINPYTVATIFEPSFICRSNKRLPQHIHCILIVHIALWHRIKQNIATLTSLITIIWEWCPANTSLEARGTMRFTRTTAPSNTSISSLETNEPLTLELTHTALTTIRRQKLSTLQLFLRPQTIRYPRSSINYCHSISKTHNDRRQREQRTATRTTDGNENNRRQREQQTATRTALVALLCSARSGQGSAPSALFRRLLFCSTANKRDANNRRQNNKQQ